MPTVLERSKKNKMANIIKNNFLNKYPLLARLLSGIDGRIVYYEEDSYGYSARQVEVCRFKQIFPSNTMCYMRELYLNCSHVTRLSFYHQRDDLEAYLKTQCAHNYDKVLQTHCDFWMSLNVFDCLCGTHVNEVLSITSL